MPINHLTIGARARMSLVVDDGDRFELVREIGAALGTVLAFCVMDTHLHVVAEGSDAAERLTAAATRYTRAFNRRHGWSGGLRGKARAIPVGDREQLVMAIRYVHENPVKAKIVARALDYPWSSQRTFAGLRRSGLSNVVRACALLGDAAGRAIGGRMTLAGLEPAMAACAHPDEILDAAADAFGLDPRRVASRERSAEACAARAAYVRLGEVESLCHEKLAPPLGLTRSAVTKLASRPVDDAAVRAARTLLYDPALRARIPRSAQPFAFT